MSHLNLKRAATLITVCLFLLGLGYYVYISEEQRLEPILEQQRVELDANKAEFNKALEKI